MLIHDADLLRAEPAIFENAESLARTLVSVADGGLSEGVVSSASADFERWSIDAGHVIFIADEPYEVIERIDAQTLSVAHLRDQPDDPPVTPSTGLDGTDLSVTVRTFARQMRQGEARVMSLLGLETSDDAAAMLTSPAGQGALLRGYLAERIVGDLYSRLAAGSPENAVYGRLAALHHQRAARAAGRLEVRIVQPNGRVSTRRLDQFTLRRM